MTARIYAGWIERAAYKRQGQYGWGAYPEVVNMRVCALLLLLVASAFAAPYGQGFYTGHRLVSVMAETREQLKALASLESSVGAGLDFWLDPGLSTEGQVRVPPNLFSAVVEELKRHQISFRVLSDDVQSLLDSVPVSVVQSAAPRNFNPNLDHSRYHTLASIESNLQGLAASYPTLAKVGNLSPQTYEGRNIKFIELSSNGGGTRPMIFLECGIHAREWISPAVCQYLADRLLAGYTSLDADARYALDNFDWSIMVVANPDGYQYTQTERLWRKNRAVNPNTSCRGTDLNRNFEAEWNTTGVSQNPCSDTYPGQRVFSEAEAQAIRAKVNEYKSQNERLIAFIPIHSYSQYILTPSAYRQGCRPSNAAEIDAVGNAAAAALRAVHNKIFRVDTAPNILYEASGGSDDWAGIVKVRYTWTYELRPGANDWRVGFQLPANEIVPSGEEFWAAMIATARNMAREHLPSKVEICN